MLSIKNIAAWSIFYSLTGGNCEQFREKCCRQEQIDLVSKKYQPGYDGKNGSIFK